ncbi:MAG: AAA family ATPase [Streptosporangiaceae bacterium]
MIRRLTLTNWRAYEHAELDLEPGTTFVVARNGIGKTSLIEGATWALYGDAGGRPSDAIRLGAPSAIASATVVLPDRRTLTVTRELPRRLARNAIPPVSATIDGREVSSSQVDAIIREVFRADPAFLARLTMLRGREQPDADAPTLNLQEHLCHFFGIDGLQDTLTELKTRQKDIDRRIKLVKQTSGVSARQLSEYRARHEAALRLVAAAEQAHRASVDRAQAAADAQRETEAHDAWQARYQEYLAQLAELGEEISSRFGVPAATDDSRSALNNLETATLAQLDGIRRERGLLEGRIAGIRAAIEQLDTTAGQCPVCLKPLSQGEAITARSEHDREVASLAAQLHHLDEAITETTLMEIRGYQRRVAEIAAPSQRPPQPPAAASELSDRHAELERAVDLAAEKLIERRSEVMAAAALIRNAESDQRAHEILEAEFTSHALVTAATDALNATITALLRETIEPLAREISNRWKRLFAERGTITLSSDGTVSRDVNGETLPFQSFSTGEKTGAQLLLRLLVLDAATSASFCWIDEPLEHLDPDTRRQVASLLAVASATSNVGQVLVTTYEEPLVRRIAQRMPEHVRVVYVRTGSDA